MRLIILLSCSLFFAVSSNAQVFDLEANAADQTQLRIRSFGNEIFDFKVDDAGVFKIFANGDEDDQVFMIDDETENIVVGSESPFPEVRLWSDNTSTSPDNRYGLYGSGQGAGTGNRYGVVGYVDGNTGNRYGVFGWSPSTANGHWGVYCMGNMWYTGSLTSVSDRRLKSNIRDSEPGLAEVMKLQPRSYTYDQGDYKNLSLAGGTQIGFVAQELEKILPGLVETNIHSTPTAPGEESSVERYEIKGINYIGLIPVLTKAIQEQQELISNLEQRIKILESKK